MMKSAVRSLLGSLTTYRYFRVSGSMDTKSIQMHHLYDKNNEVIGKTMFSMDEDESHGTQKFFYLAGPILDTLERGKYGGLFRISLCKIALLMQLVRKRRQEKRNLTRKRPGLSVLPTILIVCEGKNTEPSYFNALAFKSATIHPVGEGYNTISLYRTNPLDIGFYCTISSLIA